MEPWVWVRSTRRGRLSLVCYGERVRHHWTWRCERLGFGIGRGGVIGAAERDGGRRRDVRRHILVVDLKCELISVQQLDHASSRPAERECLARSGLVALDLRVDIEVDGSRCRLKKLCQRIAARIGLSRPFKAAGSENDDLLDGRCRKTTYIDMEILDAVGAG